MSALEDRTKLLRELCATGYSNAEIGEQLGASARTVQRWRAMAGIPSTWTPETADLVHGTETGHRHHGCTCTRCTNAAAAAQARRVAKLQRETAKTARRHLDPWTPGDDAVVLMHPAYDAAIALGRTYAAVRTRRARLLTVARLRAAQSRQETATN